MGNSLFLMILLQILLIALNAIFACAEIAVISMNDNKLERMAADGDKRARRLAQLTAQPARFLSTIQIAITLSGFLGSAFAAENFSGVLVNAVLKLGVPIPEATLDTIAVMLITLILSYFTLVFGELLPKQIAMRKAEPLALALSGLLSAIASAFRPLVWLLTASTNSLLRLLGIDPNAETEEVSEEEIRMMVDVGSEKGTIDQDEKEFIQQSRYSLYPVCSESTDNIVGILKAKEYFRLTDKSRDSVLKNAVIEPLFVPASMKADILFRGMKSKHCSMAVVLDEYGGTIGIVTLNDLLEQLVGDLGEDEHDSFAANSFTKQKISPIMETE